MFTSKPFYFVFIIVIIAGALVLQPASGPDALATGPESGSGGKPVMGAAPDAAGGRPDLVIIDIPDVEGRDDMPAVRFLHEPHRRAAGGDCTVCHLKTEDATSVFLFKRLADREEEEMDAAAIMDLYHDNCVACHVEKRAGAQNAPETSSEKIGGQSGPLAGECRACHSTKRARVPQYQPGQQPVSFDRSLHFRHEQSKQIKPAVPVKSDAETNCAACHHEYNAETQKIFYEKGKASACIYCHKAQDSETGRSIRRASHDACVACHRKLLEKDVVAGPVECINCHGQGAFKDIKTIKNVPRIKRDQPDTLFITGWGDLDLTPAELKNKDKKFMHPVAFNHQSHEAKTESCTDCHHQSLESCGRCHTPAGDEKGGYVRLDQAMHADSTHSCLGCHDTAKQAADCAGCHFSRPKKSFADQDCEKCHATDLTPEQFAALGKAGQNAKAARLLKALAETFRPVKPSKIPETVKIGVIAKEYEPSELPHRKIVTALTKKVADNKMAAVFHGDGRNLCRGCHHNSPLSETPPSCASCHGRSSMTTDGRPGLKGAYHRQCITCHQQMNIEAVQATDCTKCHKEKQ